MQIPSLISFAMCVSETVVYFSRIGWMLFATRMTILSFVPMTTVVALTVSLTFLSACFCTRGSHHDGLGPCLSLQLRPATCLETRVLSQLTTIRPVLFWGNVLLYSKFIIRFNSSTYFVRTQS